MDFRTNKQYPVVGGVIGAEATFTPSNTRKYPYLCADPGTLLRETDSTWQAAHPEFQGVVFSAMNWSFAENRAGALGDDFCAGLQKINPE